MRTLYCHVNPCITMYAHVFPCITIYNQLLKTGSLVNAIQDFLLAQPLWYMSQYTIISKYGKRTRQSDLKRS